MTLGEHLQSCVNNYIEANARAKVSLAKMDSQLCAIHHELGLDDGNVFGAMYQLLEWLKHTGQIEYIHTDNETVGPFEVLCYYWIQDPKINDGQPFQVAFIKIFYYNPKGGQGVPFFPLPVDRKIALDYLVIDQMHGPNQFNAYFKENMFRAIINSLKTDMIAPGTPSTDPWTINQHAAVRGIF